MVKNKFIDEVELDGGILCLDFVNTVHSWEAPSPREYIGSFEDLLYFALHKWQIISESAAATLEKAAATHPAGAAAFVEEIFRPLRNLQYRLFTAISQGKAFLKSDLDQFNAAWNQYSPYLLLKEAPHPSLLQEAPTPSSGAGANKYFTLTWQFPSDRFEQLTAPALQSARDLLLSGKLERVKACPSCGWLFLDTTKNGKRRWCSMKGCGSSAKALDYYYRHKEN